MFRKANGKESYALVNNDNKLETVSSGGGGGDATEAKQDDIISQLTTLNTNFTDTNTNNIKGDIDSINTTLASGVSIKGDSSGTPTNIAVENGGKLQVQVVGSNDINGSTPHRHLTIDANGRTLTNPLMTTTNTKLDSIISNTDFVVNTETIHSGSTQTVGFGSSHTFTTVLDKDGASNFTIFIDCSVSSGSVDASVDVLTSYQNTGTFYEPDSAVIGLLTKSNQYLTFINEPARYMKFKITNNGMVDLDITNFRVSFVKGI